MNKAKEVRVVVDIGGSFVKLMYQTSEEEQIQTKKVESAPIFEKREEMCSKLLSLLENECNIDLDDINIMVFSVTGQVSTEQGVVKTSDRLNEFCDDSQGFNRYPWKKEMEKELKQRRNNVSQQVFIAVVSDVFSHAMAGFYKMYTAEQKEALVPFEEAALIIALGTMPTVSIIHLLDYGKQPQLLTCESWASKLQIIANGNALSALVNCCSKVAFETLLNSNDKGKVDASSRINAMIKQCLLEYKRKFQSQPRAVVLSGGNANLLIENIAFGDLGAIQGYILKQDEQLVCMFHGCMQLASFVHENTVQFKWCDSCC